MAQSLKQSFTAVVTMVLESNPVQYAIEFNDAVAGKDRINISSREFTNAECDILESGRPFSGVAEVTEVEGEKKFKLSNLQYKN